MPRFPKHNHLVKLDTSLSQYVKYCSSLNNHDKERQIIYGDSNDLVYFTYRLMTGDKHDLLPATEKTIREIVDQYQRTTLKELPPCRDEIFKTLHIHNWEVPPAGVSPGFVLYCRASAYRYMKSYQRDLREGKTLSEKQETSISAVAISEQLIRSLCLNFSEDDTPSDQTTFYRLWETYLTAQGLALDPLLCKELVNLSNQHKVNKRSTHDSPPSE